MRLTNLIPLKIGSLLLLSFCLSSCISVNLGPSPVTTATDVSYTSPSSPFKEMASAPSADKTWIHSKSKSIITYLSECGDISHIRLKEAAATSFKAQDLKLIEQKSVTQSGQPALQSRGEPTDPKKNVMVEMINFKTKDCLFSLAFVASKNHFDEDHPTFDQFLKIHPFPKLGT